MDDKKCEARTPQIPNWDPYGVDQLCEILNSFGIDTLDGEDGPLIDALMTWKHAHE